MYALLYDLRFAFCQLRNAPGFSLTVILTRALAIGATSRWRNGRGDQGASGVE
jgi:hypothetical protein